MKTTSIITGDIINSRNISADAWLPILKTIFNTLGSTPKNWEVYRGDSFQLEVTPKEALKICLLIKSGIKQIANLDVRLAVGIGSKTFDAATITESNGEAFINSGYAFDNLLKKQTLAIKSPWKEVNEELDVSVSLALLVMDDWTANSAEFVHASIQNPKKTQKEMGDILNISQAGISKRRKRAGYEEIMKLENRYRKLITKKIAEL
ncbi:transcriptional regulator [Tenacibaculum sp. IB213877]|uniref:transcriptional regulator n=1 Tax=Tenacibaculum sp. IB213877 TaxID=3097351 RepID=UPI002A59D7AA|nr:transcriptional regulator [Tenacibaculum sp. IB213877]MDY0779658.1 transcriptional regulator [Tenacibaculum sp. IB213877]